MKRIAIAVCLTTLALPVVFRLRADDRKAKVLIEAGLSKETIQGDLQGAIEQYQKAVKEAGANRALAAKALMQMAECYRKLGDSQANKIFQQIVRDYSDQRDVLATAQAGLDAGGRAAGSGAVNRQIFTLPAEADNPGRVSADGRYIAYTSGTDLMVREVATGTERAVAHFTSGRPGYTLAWSPDGRRLAFEFDRDDGLEIRTINVDGSGQRMVLPAQPWARVLDFFPDGNRVLCSMSANGDSQVFWLNLADGSIHNLVLRKGGGGSGWPRLSPDGRYVALRNTPGLSLLATDGSGETVISRNPGDSNAVAWSPDGSRVLFIRTQNDRVDLWAAPVSNGKPNGAATMVYPDVGDIGKSDVTKDGSLYYPKSSGSGGEIYTAPVDFAVGKVLTQPLPEFSRGPGMAVWSPDGKYLAHAPDFSSPPVLLVRSVESGQARNVAPKLRSLGAIDWSPDGMKFAVTGVDLAGPQRQQGIFWVDAQTGDVQPIASAPGVGYESPRQSPDGRTLYYVRQPQRVSFERELVERNLGTGQERVLTDESAVRGKYLGGVRPSPDGLYLAYTVDDPPPNSNLVIYLRTVNTGETREVHIPSSQASRCHPLDWTRDSGALIYGCDVPPGNNGSLGGTWILPLAGLKPRKLDLGFSTISGVSVHPDGQRIAFSVNRPSRTEFHVLENFLRPAK